ncbi:DinB family protein [Aureibaculum sp. 2210JD6-5]|uniref:DinB family protein n=1 Tax=Aureibaculum sp. 2210JD6-5 TaxID=3103957 RepID=UPI002AACCA23|nr:DinB family protein [Aureibaculum sp. 2210JD6-5]MDY7395323.1 DinB family protein [Aureibaculum sp. 2210JD6-5]
MNKELTELFARDLDRLKNEFENYSSDDNLWIIEQNVSNSGGNLGLHLIGNLNHFVGAILGNTNYIRERDKEFSDKNVPLNQILSKIDETKQMVIKVIGALSENELDKIYPINIRKEGMTTRQFLFHLYGHLNYHLGQINYHRRLLDKC